MAHQGKQTPALFPNSLLGISHLCSQSLHESRTCEFIRARWFNECLCLCLGTGTLLINTQLRLHTNIVLYPTHLKDDELLVGSKHWPYTVKGKNAPLCNNFKLNGLQCPI